MRLADVVSRKVAIWGYGREGQAALSALRHIDPTCTPTILNDTPLDGPKREILLRQGLSIVEGEAVDAALRQFDVVIKSPGIPRYREAILEAEQSGVTFTSSTRLWFAENPDQKTVCVTGTKGKSTTVSLIHALIQHAGLDSVLCGNIGRPLLETVAAGTTGDVWVVEMSSYQTSDFDADPDVALLLNLSPEHLDWHGSAERYFFDKTKLMRQVKQGVCIVNAQNAESYQRANAESWNNLRYFENDKGFHSEEGWLYRDGDKLFPASKIALPGPHNLSNICAALTVLEALGLEPNDSLDVLRHFKGLQHRLMVLGERDGLTFVDDSISTTPVSTMAALEAFPDRQVTLLIGGFDRGLNWKPMARYLMFHRPDARVITLPDTGLRLQEAVDALKQSNPHIKAPKLVHAETVAEAVTTARKITPVGGLVLLSPASPSYNQYRNYMERGRDFAQAAGFSKP